MSAISRILFAAPQSGSGKTTIVCGFLEALLQRNLRPASFKCGPDYIDPMFHRSVLGIPGHNLDLFFTKEPIVRGLLAQGAKQADLAVIEGVMGFYDGMGGNTDRASSWHLASVTQTPVIMVLNVRGISLTLAALLKGLDTFREDSRIGGVILNHCGEGLYQKLAPVIEAETSLPVFGYLPKKEEFAIESRHLGLLTAQEVEGLKEKISLLAQQMEKTINIDKILQLAAQAPSLEGSLPRIEPLAAQKPVLAVAKDTAFCFYYEENLQLLRDLGCELVFFSPLTDSSLPQGAQGLYLGGGYPELHAEALSKNTSMLQSIREAVQNGLPTLAECGGFLYLQQNLQDTAGQIYPMVGALEGQAFPTHSLRRFGYVQLQAQAKNILCGKGGQIAAHEFHYWDTDRCGQDFTATKPISHQQWDCVVANPSLWAGFPHLYFWSNPEFAANFVKAIINFKI